VQSAPKESLRLSTGQAKLQRKAQSELKFQITNHKSFTRLNFASQNLGGQVISKFNVQNSKL